MTACARFSESAWLKPSSPSASVCPGNLDMALGQRSGRFDQAVEQPAESDRCWRARTRSGFFPWPANPKTNC